MHDHRPSMLVLAGVAAAASILIAGWSAPARATTSAGNGFYTVYIDDGSDAGRYTATTGPSHPAGDGLNVLYGDGDPGTTFNTIRSYTTGTDYAQSSASSTNTVVEIGSFGTTSPLGSTGARTVYALPGPPTTPDKLTITQDVAVNGSTFENSTVEVTTAVSNDGAAAVQIGIRYEWDYEIGSDDGPTFRQRHPDGTVLLNETEFAGPPFLAYEIVDNDGNPNPPTFKVLGTVTGPASVVPRPTPPDLLQFVCWPDAVDVAFEYTVDPSHDATTSEGCNDSAVNYFFGHDQAHALTVPPGGSATVSASLFLVAGETDCADRIDNDHDGKIDCADPDCGPDPACLEICGNCIDDNDDGKTDYEDPRCCAATAAMQVRTGRVLAGKGGLTNGRLGLKSTLGQSDFAGVDPTSQDVTLQLRKPAAELLCVNVGHERWSANKKRNKFTFKDRKGSVAQGLRKLGLKVKKDGSVGFLASGKNMDLSGFTDPSLTATVRVGDRCSAATIALRKKGKNKGLVYP